MKFEQLQAFRQQAYQCLGNAKDATFELADAVMTTRHISCLGDLALSLLFRREWLSVYEALQDCRPDRSKLMQLYIQQMSQVERPLLAIDHTAWLRPHAPTLKERTYSIFQVYEVHPRNRVSLQLSPLVMILLKKPGFSRYTSTWNMLYEHQATALPHGIPVGIGQGYSTSALIPEMSGSWALPLRHERITSWDNPIGKGAQKLTQVCQYLQNRPSVLFNSE